MKRRNPPCPLGGFRGACHRAGHFGPDPGLGQGARSRWFERLCAFQRALSAIPCPSPATKSQTGHHAGRAFSRKPPGSGGDEPLPAGTALAPSAGVTRPTSFGGQDSLLGNANGDRRQGQCRDRGDDAPFRLCACVRGLWFAARRQIILNSFASGWLAEHRVSDRLERMRRNPVGDWTIRDVEAVCREYAVVCEPARGGGSHYKVAHRKWRRS